MFFFQLPQIPELLARRHDYALLLRAIRNEPVRTGAFSDDDIAQHREALAQPGALTAALNYYRAMFRPWNSLVMQPIAAPVLVLWGERDRHMGRELATPQPNWVPNAQVTYLAEATHSVQHDCPERVAELLITFLTSDRQTVANDRLAHT
jgi:pimeloyl-ACP methyl ester carboxylesterase